VSSWAPALALLVRERELAVSVLIVGRLVLDQLDAVLEVRFGFFRDRIARTIGAAAQQYAGAQRAPNPPPDSQTTGHFIHHCECQFLQRTQSLRTPRE